MRKSQSEPQGLGLTRPPPRPSRLGLQPTPPRVLPSIPTSPTSDTSSLVRSTSSSPGREAARARLAVGGKRFCIATGSPSQTPPNDDLPGGRKSPFISSRTWPKGLRTRSASKERVQRRQQAILEHNPVEQIKAFQGDRLAELGLREGGRVEAARGALTLPNNGGGPKCAGEGIARSTSLAAFGNNRTSRLNNHSQNLPASEDPFSVLPKSRQSLAANTPPRQTESAQLPRSTSMGTLAQPSFNLPVPDPIPNPPVAF